MATVNDVLETKGLDVLTAEEGMCVLDAVHRMNEHHIGSLVVVDCGRVVGVFTERDVLRRIVGERRDPTHTLVGDVMTRKVVCCTPDTSLNEVQSIMKDRRIRHLPVVDDFGTLLGMLSMGDLNAWSLRDGQVTIQYLQEYIHGRV